MGAFDPPVGRKSSVVVLSRQVDDTRRVYRIVTSISTRSSTEVIEVQSISGDLQFPPDHTFTDEASALEAQDQLGFEEIARGSALLGYVATETMAGILLATRLTTKATLPGGHQVFLVSEAQWETFPLDFALQSYPTASESDFWRCIQQHSVSGTHFFCETADLTRPFPSCHRPADPDPEFVWNSWLAQPLKTLGLHSHCPALLQGAVESADEVHPTGQRYTLALISRRSRRHPGTRYIARGLNELGGPGNEIEAELLMWTPSAGACGGTLEVRWARVAWRRGTVPIWWGVEIQPLNKGLQAEVYVRDRGPYVGMLSYFRGLKRLAAREASGIASDVDGVVTCINLLHCNPKKAAELMLSEHFQEGIRHVRERLSSGLPAKATGKEKGGGDSIAGAQAGCIPPRVLKFDWHGNFASFTEEKAIEVFWHFMQEPVKQSGFALGAMLPADDALASDGSNKNTTTERDVTPWGRGWQMHWKQRQQGLLRFNCADSLDRTNAATCFAMLPTLQEGLRLLGIPLDVTTRPAASALQRSPMRTPSGGSREDLQTSSGNGGEYEGCEEILPEGWEKKEFEGRPCYIDHVNRKTQWEPPEGTISTAVPSAKLYGTSAKEGAVSTQTAGSSAPGPSPAASDDASLGPPWAFFSYSLNDVRLRLYADALSNYVSMFRKHGDVHSALYTGSPAMHSHVLGQVLSADARPYAASTSVGRLQNLRVAVQRRWNNTVSDAARQQSIEVFLGINLSRHCPGLRLSPFSATASPADDLPGLDNDDVEEADLEAETVHQGAELRNLHLIHHDNRVGLQEDLSNLEPLPSDVSGSDSDRRNRSGGASLRRGDHQESSDEDEGDAMTVSLDPLGAVRTPVHSRGAPSRNGDAVSSGSLLGDLLL